MGMLQMVQFAKKIYPKTFVRSLPLTLVLVGKESRVRQHYARIVRARKLSVTAHSKIFHNLDKRGSLWLGLMRI